MGLLDDAIREHLELKRLRGADPGAVAREEQDALGPVPRRGDAAYEGETEHRPGLATHEDEVLHTSDPLSTAGPDDSGSGDQETVEINMEAEFASEDDLDPPPVTDRNARNGPLHPASTRAIGDESLELEALDEVEEPSEPAEFDDDRGTDAGESIDKSEPVKDVLEEIPDFLRETPEQERLWLEQRPPRDFDFDE
jgi:hypothetical protein